MATTILGLYQLTRAPKTELLESTYIIDLRYFQNARYVTAGYNRLSVEIDWRKDTVEFRVEDMTLGILPDGRDNWRYLHEFEYYEAERMEWVKK